MTIRRFGGTKTVRAVFAAATIMAVLAACAPTGNLSGHEPPLRYVLAVGYDNMAEKYIEPVDVRKMALAGMESLSFHDSNLAVSVFGANVRLSTNDLFVAEEPAPKDDDPIAWAWLPASMLETARQTSPAVRAMSSEDLYQAVFKEALSGFDRYSRYAAASKARTARSMREGFGGIGVTIKVADDVTTITRVHPRTPAAKTGLRVDDRITHVDGDPIGGLAQSTVIHRLRGRRNTEVRLTIARDGASAPVHMTLGRKHIVPPTVKTKREGNIIELTITGFNQKTAESVGKALIGAERDGPIAGIVLDLRNNPGGLLDQAVTVVDMFLGAGPIISTRGRHPGSNQVFEATEQEMLSGIPLVIVVNGKSASAAEIVAAALRDRGRAAVIGTSSYGKGTVQTIVRLPNGGELTLTWSRIFTPADAPLNRLGVVPVICTGGKATSVADVLAQLSKASQGPWAREAVQPAQAAYTDSEINRMRAAFPPEDAKSRLDLEIARHLVRDASLYAESLRPSRPAVAAR